MPDTFRCYLVSKGADGQIQAAMTQRPLAELPAGDVLIRVAYSSLNYKDALAATGNPAVVRRFPHVPGIDAAGVVTESSSSKFRAGDEVIVTGFELGAGAWGGYSEYIRVPADWVLPRPANLTLRDAMVYGTAGLTAGLSVGALVHQGVTPIAGEIVVTGASGGVGSVAVAILSKLGYPVVVVSGKPEARELLTKLGASRIIGRDEVLDDSTAPLLKARWAGAVDTVGGKTLATILRATNKHGCVTACGLVGGSELLLTVMPFILRGVSLVGIDSAWCPLGRRQKVWQHLAGDWRPPGLESLAHTIELADLDRYLPEILAGRTMGRIVVKIAPDREGRAM